MYFVKESIYFISLNHNNNNILVSYSYIRNINNSTTIYNNRNIKNNKFSLILNKSNNKIIGINDNNLKSKGEFFTIFIDGFKKKYPIINKFKKNNKYRFYQNKTYFLDDKYYNLKKKIYIL